MHVPKNKILVTRDNYSATGQFNNFNRWMHQQPVRNYLLKGFVVFTPYQGNVTLV